MTLVRLSGCKVNLLLNILYRRPDGFHELETVMQPVPLCDKLTFTRCPHGVELSCDDPRLPVDSGNLVHRAAATFLATANCHEGVRIRLEKRIPLAAGLGGGSGNAATTLLAMNELFGQPLAAPRLYEMAAALGSDVPFFLQNGPALATGRGEQTEPLPPFPPCTVPRSCSSIRASALPPPGPIDNWPTSLTPSTASRAGPAGSSSSFSIPISPVQELHFTTRWRLRRWTNTRF